MSGLCHVVWRSAPSSCRITSCSRLCRSIQHRRLYSVIESGHEEVSVIEPELDRLDVHIERLSKSVHRECQSVRKLFEQYQQKAGKVIARTVPYEERPKQSKWAHTSHMDQTTQYQGDGLVMVVHACAEHGKLRTTVCSGFVVDASVGDSSQGDVVVTCAHTLEEMHRHLKYRASSSVTSYSFVIPSKGPPRAVINLLSSKPRFDVVLLEVKPASDAARLRSLPLTPFPVHMGTPVLTHLFGSPNVPIVKHSIARTRAVKLINNVSELEMPIPWIDDHAWRRWGAGIMLGYRSYTGLELEAGLSSVLPHILTSILPTSGSSGGPLVNGETGCVVGMISGRRMDNYVEGERGWGCSSEGIFEMFSLPGFMPMMK